MLLLDSIQDFQEHAVLVINKCTNYASWFCLGEYCHELIVWQDARFLRKDAHALQLPILDYELAGERVLG